MARKNEYGKYVLSAGEIGAFTVCPLSWKLKWVDKLRGINRGSDAKLGKELHYAWVRRYDEAFQLSRTLRYLLVLLCVSVVIFLLVRAPSEPLKDLLSTASHTNLTELLGIVILGGIVFEIIRRAIHRETEETGLGAVKNAVSIDGSSALPGREYISEMQCLAGKPDALLIEDGNFIPIERKPLARKLRDRYIAQLLVYMRLVEEFEGKRPPYGYLVLGKNCRRVRIDNSDSKQSWLQTHIDQMHHILDGAPAIPAPHEKKCERCDVRHLCPEGSSLVQIRRAGLQEG